MKVWAIANQKGGVAKTTTAITIAALLSSRGNRTLLVDMDPHGSMTAYFGYDPDTIDDSLYGLFSGDGRNVEYLCRETAHEYLDLLPASTAIATLDRQLATQQGKGLVISYALRELNDRYDYVLIDCPPVLGVLMVNALAACDFLIIPVQTEFLALKGLERITNTIAMMNRGRKIALPYIILPTMYDCRTRASKQTLELLQEKYKSALWDSVIPVDTRFRDASLAGIPAPYYAPNSRGVRAYEALLESLSDFDQSVMAVAS